MIPIRIRIVALIALGTIINYLDRINISVAGPKIMEETGWDKAEWGWVLSIFLVGYALFQYPGGALADRWGPRKVIGLSCIGFSLFTALTPLGQGSMILLLAMRFMVGACESMSFPSFASMNSRWIPRNEFARAQAVLLSGVYLGQVLAYPTTTWIIVNYSWQTVFYVNSFVGLLWVGLWFWYTRDEPADHPSISSEEAEKIRSGTAARSQASTVSFLTLIKHRIIIYICLSYALYGFIAWMFIFWFPPYLMQGRGMTTMEMGLVGMVPIGAGFVGVMAGGWTLDYLIKKGMDPRTVKVRLPGLLIVASAPFLAIGVNVESTTLAIASFGIFYCLFSSSLPGYWSLPLELNPKFVGSIIGLANTSANAFGVLGPITAGQILERTNDNWHGVFYLAAVLTVVCGAIYAIFVRADPLDLEESPGPDESGDIGLANTSANV